MAGRIERLLGIRVGLRAKDPSPDTKLGLLERWYAAQPSARVAAVVIEWDAPLATDALTAALTKVRDTHRAALGVTLVTDDAGTRRQPVPTDSPLPIEQASADDVWRATEDALHEAFRAGDPLWRVRWTSNRRALVAVFHHVIADGMSAAIFARDLIRALNGEAPEVSVRQAPLEASLDTRPSLGLLLREVKSAVLKMPSPTFYRGTDQSFASLRTVVTTNTLPRAAVEAIARAARIQQTTVHGALVAAAAHACAGHHGRLPLQARVVSPVSLRRSMTPPATGMGVFLCAVESDHEIRSELSFWEFARHYGRRLREGIPTAIERVGLLAFAGDLNTLAQRITDDAHNGRTATVEVSNLGRASFDPSGRARVWFTQGNHYHGPLFNLSTVTDEHSGELMLCLATPSPLIDRAQAQQFLDVFRATLTRAAESPMLSFADAASAMATTSVRSDPTVAS